jgi:hypothetical protein
MGDWPVERNRGALLADHVDDRAVDASLEVSLNRWRASGLAELVGAKAHPEL